MPDNKKIIENILKKPRNTDEAWRPNDGVGSDEAKGFGNAPGIPGISIYEIVKAIIDVINRSSSGNSSSPQNKDTGANEGSTPQNKDSGVNEGSSYSLEEYVHKVAQELVEEYISRNKNNKNQSESSDNNNQNENSNKSDSEKGPVDEDPDNKKKSNSKTEPEGKDSEKTKGGKGSKTIDPNTDETNITGVAKDFLDGDPRIEKETRIPVKHTPDPGPGADTANATLPKGLSPKDVDRIHEKMRPTDSENFSYSLDKADIKFLVDQIKIKAGERILTYGPDNPELGKEELKRRVKRILDNPYGPSS